MENEKILNSNDEIKIRKKFKIYATIARIFQVILITGLVALLVIFVSTGIIIKSSTVEDEEDIIENTTIVEESNDEDFETLEKIMGVSIEELETDPIFSAIKIVCKIATYILVILTLGQLIKLFKNMEKEESPFTEENVKHIYRITEYVGIIYIIAGKILSIELILFITLCAITYIFKYGCKLQKESDELL